VKRGVRALEAADPVGASVFDRPVVPKRVGCRIRVRTPRLVSGGDDDREKDDPDEDDREHVHRLGE
jgi:hypothetical protein